MNHEFWMKKALLEAQKAFDQDEVPVGAVITNSQGVIASAFNRREENNDPCGHAEILVLKKAAQNISSWRLTDCSLYVTLEPCMMCTGALIQSRIKSLIYGASDPKGGFINSIEKGLGYTKLNHKVDCVSGVLQKECSEILSLFFKERRKAR